MLSVSQHYFCSQLEFISPIIMSMFAYFGHVSFDEDIHIRKILE